MVSSICVTTLSGWTLTQRAKLIVNSHQQVILALQLFPTVLYASEGAILCFSIRNHNQQLAPHRRLPQPF